MKEVRTIRVPAMTRVEGEGALSIELCDGMIQRLSELEKKK